MRSISDSGIGKRTIDSAQADPGQRDPGHCPNALYITGIGPGDPRHLSARARQVLQQVDTVAGYTTYIDLIRPLIPDKPIIATGMKKEVQRVSLAIETARQGRSCALVSSGDPGIYAMAGLALELCHEKQLTVARLSDFPVPDARKQPDVYIEVVPGIPALCSGASLLGAPLTHDFAAISLSDLLTPWELIEKRLEAAAKADFVIVLYNPKSKRRNTQLAQACQIIQTYRDPETPVGIVSRAMRDGQTIEIIPLRQLAQAQVDMLTTVFIGSSASVGYLDFMYTPRGYGKKYDLVGA